MQMVVISNDVLKDELCSVAVPENIIWLSDIQHLKTYEPVDVVIDLLFENSPERKALLKQTNATIIINSVVETLAQTDPSFVRINGWNTLLKSPVVEAAANNEAIKNKAETIFHLFGKTVRWIPDVAGFITPRVISMMINEAYYALEEGVSTKEEINTAMKLGTNYPYGPFEWSEKIGTDKVKELLQNLSNQQSRYRPVIK